MYFILQTYVDTDRAGDRLTRQSRSGIFLFTNIAPNLLAIKEANVSQDKFFW